MYLIIVILFENRGENTELNCQLKQCYFIYFFCCFSAALEEPPRDLGRIFPQTIVLKRASQD